MKKMLAHEIGPHQWAILKDALGFKGSERELEVGLKKIAGQIKNGKDRDRNKGSPSG